LKQALTRLTRPGGGGAQPGEYPRMIAAMYRSALQANPATNAQSAAQQNVVGQLDALVTARAQRASDVDSRLPARAAGRGNGHLGGGNRVPVRGLRQSSMSLTPAGLQAVLVAVGVVVVFQLNLAHAAPLAVGPGAIQTVGPPATGIELADPSDPSERIKLDLVYRFYFR
jgi:hypothetical protein